MNEPAPGSVYLGVVELRIPAEPEWVAVARLAVAAVANRIPFSVDEIEDLKLAIAEACTNCIQQANGPTTIDITFEVAPDFLRMRVRDGNARADAPKPHSVSLSEGLGIFLIQAIMDKVEYNVDPHTGSELVMTKKLGS
jgi:serine/threonine-protein kinase RsbW